MDERAGGSRAAVGLVVKSGWAAAVLVIGSPASPRVVDSRRIELSDPAISESRQPYHAGFGTARDSGAERTRLIRVVRRFGRRSVTTTIRSYTETAGRPLAGAGVVVGSLIDPERIANAHIRIHALEGQLFRGVVQEAALKSALPCSIWRERDLYALAADALGQPEPHIRSTVSALGRGVANPWRAEQKTATVAAWLVLAASGRTQRVTRKREQYVGR